MKLGNLEVWEDVLDESLDTQVAPELGDVISGEAHKIYTDSREFFRRTYFTDSMIQIFERLLDTFEKGGKHNLFLIYSLFGGGKTHTILAIYHAFKDPNALFDDEVLEGYPEEKKEKIKHIAERLKNVNVKIVPIYGKGHLGQPSKPLDFGAYKVRTVWGYMGHALGKYYLVENDDRNYTVPAVPTIRKLFEGQKVLLLVDEIVHYFDNLYNSRDEDDRRYAGNVAKFFDAIGTALIGTDSAMVMTLPMEKKGGIEQVEKEYNKDVVLAIWQAVTRVGGAELYSPLRTEGAIGGEIVEILKKRIFRKIEGKERIVSMYRDAYSNVEVFGRAPQLLEELSRIYPFHPEYITTLRTVVERGNLQKTRDMVRITRIVVRKLVREFEESGFAPSLIMPFHVDPTNERIKGLLFGKNPVFGDYATVLDIDLNDSKFRKFSNPELTKIVVTYIFLKTYPYDHPTPLPDFPNKDRIARAIYEHNLFEAKGWLATDIVDTMDELKKVVAFIYLNIKDEIFWFWRVANVSQMIEAKKDEILSSRLGEVHRKLEDYISRMVFKGTVGKKKKSDHKIPFFNENNILITRGPQEFQDNEDYKLQILVREEREISEDLLWRIIYTYGTGTRTYRNTVAVCYLQNGSLDPLLEIVARIMACDEVKGDIKAKYQSYGDEVVEIQSSMVKHILDQNLGQLEEQVIAAFRNVAYPQDDDVTIVPATPTSKSIVQNVYDALVSHGKIAAELGFEGFVRYLKEKANKNLEKITISFGELRRLIRSNTRLPMIEDNLLKEVIKEGVRDLRIGIKRDHRVLLKQVYRDQLPSHEESGYHLDTVKTGDLIIPAKKALNELINQLLEEEKEEVKDNKIIRIWFEVYPTPSSGEIHLRDLVEKVNGEYKVKDEYYETVLLGYIVRRYEEIIIEKPREFSLDVRPQYVEGRPGEIVEIQVSLTPLKGESFEVELEVSAGELESTGGTVPFSTVWILEIPKEKREYIITARTDGNIKKKSVTLVPKTGIIEVSELEEKHKGYQLLEIKGIKELHDFEIIPERLKGYGIGNLTIEEPYYHVTFKEFDLELLREFIKPVIDFKTLLEFEVSFNMNIVVDEEVIIDDLWIQALRPLNKKVIFRLKERE